MAGRVVACGRIASQHRQIHDGRRSELPAATAAGAAGRGHQHARGLPVLSAGADGGRRWLGRAAAQRPQRLGSGGGHCRRRCADDRLRTGRRDEGHHLGADHQGRAADHRCRVDDGDGAGQVRLQLLRHPGLGTVRHLGFQHIRSGQARRACARRPVRRFNDLQDQLHLAGTGPGARHRRSAARADAVLHGAQREGSASLGGVGDRPDRCLLPVHACARLRCGGHRRARPHPRGSRSTKFGSAAAGLRAGRGDPARRDLGGGVCDHPGGGGRADNHRVDVVRARHLRQRVEESRGDRGRTGSGVADHRGGARCLRDRAGDPCQRAERRVPRRVGLRRRRCREPAHDPVFAVLAAV
jgi:hypothetical protein